MFWDQFKAPFSILAPMEGVTDLVFRQVVAKAGRPDIFFTEFTNIYSYANQLGRQNALERLQFLPSEQPIVAQIWGKTPENFALMSAGLKDLGYQAVDINTGCPDKNVVATGGGSALIRTPELAAEIIQATKSSGLAVSVKTRLGYSQVDEYQTWLPHLFKQDIQALTVHLRTKKEMSKVPAHFELIPAIVQMRNDLAPHTKLIINGDILDIQTGFQMAHEHGFDGVMIGRGVFHNPFCFTHHTPTQTELLELLHYHLDLWENYHYGQLADRTPSMEPLKRFFKVYIHGVRGAHDLRAKLMDCHNLDQVRKVLKKENL
ncbi:tRNA-dihydrouridine synthase family protein [Candidatus Saccharibacteria bacterium]|nr:tRNA-dihydrouridine synthase family protein [Candidatus Saccharibacteria bacterium]